MEDFDEYEIENEVDDFIFYFHSNLKEFLDTRDPLNSFSDIITNLENSFYVSNKDKSFYECLTEPKKSSKEKGYPLRSRIGTFYY